MAKPSKTIYVIGELNAEMLIEFWQAFRRADARPGAISVLISSNGGNVSIGNAMYELIRTSRNKVTTVGVGEIASMAVLLFVGGDKRIMTEGSSLLVHDGSVVISDSLIKAKETMEENMRQHESYIGELANRTGLSQSEIRAMAAKETYLTAYDARRGGFVHEIVSHRKS